MDSVTEPSGSGPPAPDQQQTVNIKVKTLQPATYEMALPKQFTVLELKTRLESMVPEAPIARQRIIYKGRGLQDDQTLQQLGIDNGDTVHMVVRPADALAAAGLAAPGANRQGVGAGPAARPGPHTQAHAEVLINDTRVLLEQQQTMLNQVLHSFMRGAPGPAADQQAAGGAARAQAQQQPGQQQAAGQQVGQPQQGREVVHLLVAIQRYLQHLQEPGFAAGPIRLSSHAVPAFSVNHLAPQFEALSHAMLVMLEGVELPQPLEQLREDARRDPAGRPRVQRGARRGATDDAAAAPPGEAGEAAGAAAAHVPATAAGDGSQQQQPQRPQGGMAAIDQGQYQYRYTPLALACVQQLVRGCQQYVGGALAQQLRDGEAALGELMAAELPLEGSEERGRQLRGFAGQMHAAAALFTEMARAVQAASVSVGGSPLAMAANTTAVLESDGSAPTFPRLTPRQPLVPAAVQGAIGLLEQLGMAMGGMPMGMPMAMPAAMGVHEGAQAQARAQGQQPGTAGDRAAAGAGAGQAMPTVNTFSIDITEVPGGDLNTSIGSVINSVMSAISGMGGLPAPQPGGQQQQQAGDGVGSAPRAAGATAAAAVPPPAPAGPQATEAAAAASLGASAITMLAPALASVAGSVAHGVMTQMQERNVGNAGALMDTLARVLAQRLTHVMDVVVARYDRLTRAAERQLDQQQGNEPGAGAAGALPDSEAALREFAPFAGQVNALFPSWESVMRIPAEPPEEEEEENEEGEEEAEEQAAPASGEQQQPAPAASVDGAAAAGVAAAAGAAVRRRRRRRTAAQRVADEEMSSIMQLMMPPMLGSIARHTASAVMQELVARGAGQPGSVLNGEQLALAVLNTLGVRLEGVANMVLGNWRQLSTFLEGLEEPSDEPANPMDTMSQLINMVASISQGFMFAAPPPMPMAAQHQAQHQAQAALQQAQAAAQHAQAQVQAAQAMAHQAAQQQAVAQHAAAVAQAAAHQAAAAAAQHATPAPTPAQQSAPAAAAAATGGAPEQPAAGSSAAAAGAGPSAPAPASAPRGLGLGLKPAAPKKKPAAAASTAAAAAAAPGSSPAAAPAAAAPASAAPAAAASPVPASSAAPSAPPAIAARSASAAGPLAPAAGGAAGGDLGGLMQMMGQMMGGMGGAGGGGGGGGGLGGLMQMANQIASDPAMQPMLQSAMGALIGGGAGGARGGAGDGMGGGAGGGLGGLLSSLMGGLAAPPGGAAGSRSARQGAAERSAALAADPARVGALLTQLLGQQEGARWREVLERDGEALSGHVQVGEEELSDNYRRGVPARREGVLQQLVQAGGEGSDEEEDGDQ